MKPDKVRKLYADLFLAETSAKGSRVRADEKAEDARQDVLAVLRRLQIELEHISGLAAEQGDAATATAAQDVLNRTVWIKSAINRDLVGFLDKDTDLKAVEAMVDEANDRLTNVANGTARAIRRFEKAVPVLNAVEKLMKFVKEN